jgi:hypothetical protein
VNETTAPALNLKVGDRIEHDLMPGFAMEIHAVRDCETDGNRDQPHDAYQITDPGGNADWLCSFDVHEA